MKCRCGKCDGPSPCPCEEWEKLREICDLPSPSNVVFAVAWLWLWMAFGLAGGYIVAGWIWGKP